MLWESCVSICRSIHREIEEKRVQKEAKRPENGFLTSLML